MKMYDFFLSHSSKNAALVEQIAAELEKSGAKCWYAPRNIDAGVPYSKAIVEGINDSKVFLLCLSKDSAVSDQVLNEIEVAFKRVKNNDEKIMLQPLFIEDFDIEADEYDPLTYYIKRFNYIVPKDKSTVSSIVSEIINKNNDIFKKKNEDSTKEHVIIESTYFVDENEAKRLELQSKNNMKFDGEIYRGIFSQFNNPTILDLGVGNGSQLFDRLGEKTNYLVIGLDCDGNQIERADSRYGSDKAFFYTFDVESNTFNDEIENISKKHGIDKYDIINICYLLKHLKHPGKLLSRLRKLLSENGVIIIREYDNTFEYVVPDEKGYFKRLFPIFEHDSCCGNCQMGKDVYSLLYDANYSNIKIPKIGNPTIDYSPEEKEAVFMSEFAYLGDHLKFMLETNPNNKQLLADYEWVKENIDDIYQEFMKPNVMYMSGKMIYTANK